LERLHERLETVKTHDFRVLELQPHQKDGGVFVRFAYNADNQNALETLQGDLRLEANKHGGLPSWSGLDHCNIWLVKGRPFVEVRFLNAAILGKKPSIRSGYVQIPVTNRQSFFRRPRSS
jgi:hypothetical protein